MVGDFNGDGYFDVAAQGTVYGGTGLYPPNVYLFYSTGPGGISANSASSPSHKIVGLAATGLGQLASADLDLDGYDDVVASVAYDSVTNPAKVFVFRSSGSGGIAALVPTDADTEISGENLVYFGSALSASDIDGEGTNDLVVGAGSSAVPGAVYVFRSSAGVGLVQSQASEADAEVDGELGPNSGFGSSAD